jgi:GNAT superfamily N-acetyltransferase
MPDEYVIRPLTADTWDAFAALAEKHNGVWGGCWCTWFHERPKDAGADDPDARSYKHRLVREGRAHAALVFDASGDQDAAIGWCEYGTPEELPRIYHRKEYEAGVVTPPDYRITCFFVDRDHRRHGVSAVALAGALDLVAQAGGGTVEAYPQDTDGARISASFLYNGTRSLFEQAGFVYDRPKGKVHCVMRTTVAPR